VEEIAVIRRSCFGAIGDAFFVSREEEERKEERES